MSREATMSPDYRLQNEHVQNDRWQDFIAAPVRCVAMNRIAEILDGVADDEATLTAVAYHPRFQQRLTERLMQRHGLTAPAALPPLAEEDQVILQLAPEHAGELVHYCGMICHATTFVREIRAPRVVALKQHFGTAAFLTALAHHQLALPYPPQTVDDALTDTFANTLHQDGLACVASWLAQQSDEMGAWLRLGIAADPMIDSQEISPQIREQGVAIVRCAATAVLDHHREAMP